MDNEREQDIPQTVSTQGKCQLCQHWLLTYPYKEFLSCDTGHSIHEECFVQWHQHSPQCPSLDCGLCDSKYLVGSPNRNMALKVLAIEMIEARERGLAEAEDQVLLAHPVFGPFYYLLHDDTCIV